MKLLIVDDHEIVRKGISATLSGDEDVQEILEATNLEEGMKVMTIHQPEMVLVDINLGEGNGMDLIEQAKINNVEAKFVIFTSSSRRGDFERAKCLGVEGYILKDSNIEDIIYAIKSVGRGRKFYDTRITEANQPPEKDKGLESLTKREKEIFEEIGKGATNTQIAEKLYISENTVKKHMSNVLAKLGVRSRVEVALYATKLWRSKDE